MKSKDDREWSSTDLVFYFNFFFYLTVLGALEREGNNFWVILQSLEFNKPPLCNWAIMVCAT